MGRFKHIIALLLLTLWVPLTSHELLEQAGVIHHSDHLAAAPGGATDHGPGDDGDGGHDAADGLCRIDWGGGPHLRLHAAAAVTLPLWMTVFGEDVLARLTGAVAGQPVPPGWNVAPPPERASSWQFALRAALPARAPSPRVIA